MTEEGHEGDIKVSRCRQARSGYAAEINEPAAAGYDRQTHECALGAYKIHRRANMIAIRCDLRPLRG